MLTFVMTLCVAVPLPPRPPPALPLIWTHVVDREYDAWWVVEDPESPRWAGVKMWRPALPDRRGFVHAGTFFWKEGDDPPWRTAKHETMKQPPRPK